MDLRSRISAAVEAWNAGEETFGRTFYRLLDLVTEDTVEEVVATVPPEWRRELLETFRGYRGVTSETQLITILGGCFAWDREGDPARREQMLHEHAEEMARGRARFMQVTLPAIQQWLAKHDA